MPRFRNRRRSSRSLGVKLSLPTSQRSWPTRALRIRSITGTSSGFGEDFVEGVCFFINSPFRYNSIVLLFVYFISSLFTFLRLIDLSKLLITFTTLPFRRILVNATSSSRELSILYLLNGIFALDQSIDDWHYII